MMVFGVKLKNGSIIYPRGDNTSWFVLRPDGSGEYYNDPVVLIICEFFDGEKMKYEF